jgi:hypothetical protein
MRAPPCARALAACVVGIVGGCADLGTTVVGGPVVPPEHAEVLDEQVELRCVGEGADQRCVLDGEYDVRAPTSASAVEIAIRGAAQVELRDEAGPLQRVGPTPSSPASHRRYRLDAGPDRRRLRLHVEFAPRPVKWIRLAHVPALARHQVFTELLELDACDYDRGGCEFHITYQRARPRSPRFALHVEGTNAEVAPPDEPDLEREIQLHAGQRVFAPGGPFFGLGVGYADPDVAKLRAGWELFAPSYLAHAVAVELDGRRRTSVALTSELMSPLLMFLPSVGVGAGLPIQLAPELLVGVRGQLSVQLPYLGLVTTLDVFPGAGDQRVRPSLYLQFVL